MYLGFEPTHTETKKYMIVRDYFVSNGKVQGLYFLVQEPGINELKQVFLDKEDMNNYYIPKKSPEDDEDKIKIKASGIEHGSENVLIIEKGVWKKKNAMSKIIEIPAKRYRFVLK